MAERDRFELDLADALRAYAQEAPTQVRPTEIARHFAARHPHGRTALGPWHLPTALRPAWVLLLAAALLAAIVAGMGVVGSQRERKLPAVVPPVGRLFACPPGSTPDEPGPVDQTRPAEEWSATAFDRRAGRLVVVTDAGNGVATWTFDVCTNTWTRMHPTREPSGFELRQLVYDVDSDVTIGISSRVGWEPTGRKVWAYDLQANTWTEMGVPPTDAGAWAYDPVSGLVVAEREGGLLDYDVETDTWTPIHLTNSFGTGAGALAYDASVDRMVAAAPAGVGPELFDIRTGRWLRSGAGAPNVLGSVFTTPDLEYDEAAERTMLIGNVRLAAYDATADRWEIVAAADPSNPLPKALTYDPVNERLIGWSGFGTDDQDGVVAFDMATRQWAVLLEPGEGQPTP